MATNVTVASQALNLLRESTITSFSDGSTAAEIANNFYTDFISDIFGRYPWSFAKKRAALVVDSTDPVNEWTYSHQIPSDAIRVIAIYDSSVVGAKPITRWDRIGPYIHSDSATLWMEYTYYIGEAMWPGYFIQYAVAALAALLAMPITDDPDLAAYWKRVAYGTDEENERGGKFGVAASADAQSKPPEEIMTPDLVAWRFS